jgi:hypothetical protein
LLARCLRFSLQFLYIPIIRGLMATSSRFATSLRRISTRRAVPSIQRLRPSIQTRWITSASSEPHQPDAEGTVKGAPAPAKTIAFTSEKYSPQPSIIL